MTSLVGRPGFTLFSLVAVVVVLLLAIGRLDRVVPRGSRVEAWVHRWAATAQGLVAVVGLLAAVRVIYGTDATIWRWLTLGVLFAAMWASRRALADWANGIMLRSEDTLRAGRRIGLSFGRGRIRRLGLRSAELETEDGRVLRVPYSALAEAPVEISLEEAAARSHTFEVEVPAATDPAALGDRMSTEALLSPWSSVEPAPSVRLLDQSEARLLFEVTVYPVDPSLASRVEGAVRASVAPHATS